MIMTSEFKNECLVIARDNAPFETGNTRFNSLALIEVPDGFDIKCSGVVAPYAELLDRGTRNIQMHKGWFTVSTKNKIALHVSGQYASRQEINDTLQRVMANSPDNPARQARLAQSLANIKEE